MMWVHILGSTLVRYIWCIYLVLFHLCQKAVNSRLLIDFMKGLHSLSQRVLGQLSHHGSRESSLRFQVRHAASSGRRAVLWLKDQFDQGPPNKGRDKRVGADIISKKKAGRMSNLIILFYVNGKKVPKQQVTHTSGLYCLINRILYFPALHYCCYIGL